MAKAAADLGRLEGVHYSRVAIAFHWVIAALILVNLYLGLFHDDYSKPVGAAMMFYHKSIGMTVLGLTLLRLAWRFSHRPPPFDAAVMKRWEIGLARTVHWLFYALLLAIPLSGWLLSSTGGRAIGYFGLFNIAALPVSHSDGAHDLFDTMHQLLAYGMIALIVLHVGGALKHHFEGHRHLIGRMAPWLYRRR